MQLIVLGMDRSGTSAVTRLLNMMGAYIGPENMLLPASSSNPKGSWERPDVVQLNDALLESAGASWHQVANLRVETVADEAREEFFDKAGRLVLTLDSHRPWVIKDPRMCLLFPLWHRLLEVPVCIHLYRNPFETARALKTREGLPLAVGLALWETYTLESLKASADIPRILVSYSDLTSKPLETVERLYNDLLTLEIGGLRLPSKREVLAFLDGEWTWESSAHDMEGQYLNEIQRNLVSAFERGTIFEMDLPETLSPTSQEILAQFEEQSRIARNVKVLEEQLQAVRHESTRLAEELQSRVAVLQRELASADCRARGADELQKRVSDLQRDLTAAQKRAQELANVRVKIEDERAKELRQLHQWMNQLEEGLGALLASRSWKIGRGLINLSRRLAFKRSQGTAADHMHQVLSRYKAWATKKVGTGPLVSLTTSKPSPTTPAKPGAAASAKPTAPSPANGAPPPGVGPNDNTHKPRRQSGDGRRVLSVARNQDHYWYSNHAVKEFIASLGSALPLPNDIRRILVIGHDFALTTGVSRPIYHYLNAMVAAGGVELTSIELVPGAAAAIANSEVDAADFVIINSIAPFTNHDDMVDLVKRAGARKAAIYLHETAWVFSKFEQEQPERFRRFAEMAREMNFLCVSEQQRQWLNARFGIAQAKVVYNTTTLPKPVTPDQARLELRPDAPVRVVMAGTIQPRKGVTLFSQVADMAKKQGLPWTFHWAGWEVKNSGEMYKSANVEYVGNLNGEELHEFMMGADVFFLSSVDDPFPLACLEALQAYKRVVAYRQTGVSEVIDGVSGSAVFDQHTPEHAFSALKRALSDKLDVEKYTQINRETTSVSSFVGRLNRAIAEFHGSALVDSQRCVATVLPPKQSIAVVLHLYYHDLWDEIRGYLRNFRDCPFDLYVTLTEDKPEEELETMKAAILRQYPKAQVLVVENRGMDVGPFFTVLNDMLDNKRAYDLILKVHSKKSEVVSGTEAGNKWRLGLFNDLMGSHTKIAQIVSLFDQYPHIGMIGPQGFLMGLSSADIQAGTNLNQESMDYFFNRLNLQERSLQFFRGTMFWVRADLLFNVFRENRVLQSEFEPGHVPNGGKAHAMERLFANIVRDQGKALHQFDSTMPKPVSLLKDKHKGSDIYIIAAGASCDYIEPSFFDGKIVIGVNRVFKRFRCDYVVFKETPGLEAEELMVEQGIIPIVAKWDSGDIKKGKRRLNVATFTHPSCHFYDHLENGHEKIDLSVVGSDDKLVVSYSTITSAINAAALMGAKNILLVGHDCGLLDGKAAFTGYYSDLQKETPWNNWDEYQAWLGVIEDQTIQVKEKVRAVYNCNIYSINPFINAGLEGHTYLRPSRK